MTDFNAMSADELEEYINTHGDELDAADKQRGVPDFNAMSADELESYINNMEETPTSQQEEPTEQKPEYGWSQRQADTIAAGRGRERDYAGQEIVEGATPFTRQVADDVAQYEDQNRMAFLDDSALKDALSRHGETPDESMQGYKAQERGAGEVLVDEAGHNLAAAAGQLPMFIGSAVRGARGLGRRIYNNKATDVLIDYARDAGFDDDDIEKAKEESQGDPRKMNDFFKELASWHVKRSESLKQESGQRLVENKEGVLSKIASGALGMAPIVEEFAIGGSIANKAGQAVKAAKIARDVKNSGVGAEQAIQAVMKGASAEEAAAIAQTAQAAEKSRRLVTAAKEAANMGKTWKGRLMLGLEHSAYMTPIMGTEFTRRRYEDLTNADVARDDMGNVVLDDNGNPVVKSGDERNLKTLSKAAAGGYGEAAIFSLPIGEATFGWAAPTITKALKTSLGRTAAEMYGNYVKFGRLTGLRGQPTMIGLMDLNTIKDEVLGLDKKDSEYEGMSKEWDKLRETTLSAEGQMDIFISTLGMMAVQGGAALMKARADIKKNRRSTDDMLRTFVFNDTENGDELLKKMSPEQKNFWRKWITARTNNGGYALDDEKLNTMCSRLGKLYGEEQAAVARDMANHVMKIDNTSDWAPYKRKAGTSNFSVPFENGYVAWSPTIEEYEGTYRRCEGFTDPKTGISISKFMPTDESGTDDGYVYIVRDKFGNVATRMGVTDAVQAAREMDGAGAMLAGQREAKTTAIEDLYEMFGLKGAKAITVDTAAQATALNGGKKLRPGEQAFYKSGTKQQVYVLDRINNPFELKKIVLHEVGRHRGIDVALPDPTSKLNFLSNLIKSGDPGIQRQFEHLANLYGYTGEDVIKQVQQYQKAAQKGNPVEMPGDLNRIIEETWAHVYDVEGIPNLSERQLHINAMRRGLRRVFTNLPLSREEADEMYRGAMDKLAEQTGGEIVYKSEADELAEMREMERETEQYRIFQHGINSEMEADLREQHREEGRQQRLEEGARRDEKNNERMRAEAAERRADAAGELDAQERQARGQEEVDEAFEPIYDAATRMKIRNPEQWREYLRAANGDEAVAVRMANEDYEKNKAKIVEQKRIEQGLKDIQDAQRKKIDEENARKAEQEAEENLVGQRMEAADEEMRRNKQAKIDAKRRALKERETQDHYDKLQKALEERDIDAFEQELKDWQHKQDEAAANFNQYIKKQIDDEMAKEGQLEKQARKEGMAEYERQDQERIAREKAEEEAQRNEKPEDKKPEQPIDTSKTHGERTAFFNGNRFKISYTTDENGNVNGWEALSKDNYVIAKTNKPKQDFESALRAMNPQLKEFFGDEVKGDGFTGVDRGQLEGELPKVEEPKAETKVEESKQTEPEKDKEVNSADAMFGGRGGEHVEAIDNAAKAFEEAKKKRLERESDEKKLDELDDILGDIDEEIETPVEPKDESKEVDAPKKVDTPKEDVVETPKEEKPSEPDAYHKWLATQKDGNGKPLEDSESARKIFEGLAKDGKVEDKIEDKVEPEVKVEPNTENDNREGANGKIFPPAKDHKVDEKRVIKAIDKFTSKNKIQARLMLPCHTEEGKVAATDGTILIETTRGWDKSKVGDNPDFPNYKMVIPPFSSLTVKATINPAELIKSCKEAIKLARTTDTYKNSAPTVLIKWDNGENDLFKAENIIKLAEVMDAENGVELRSEGYAKPAVFSNRNTKVVIMPLRRGDKIIPDFTISGHSGKILSDPTMEHRAYVKNTVEWRDELKKDIDNPNISPATRIESAKELEKLEKKLAAYERIDQLKLPLELKEKFLSDNPDELYFDTKEQAGKFTDKVINKWPDDPKKYPFDTFLKYLARKQPDVIRKLGDELVDKWNSTIGAKPGFAQTTKEEYNNIIKNIGGFDNGTTRPNTGLDGNGGQSGNGGQRGDGVPGGSPIHDEPRGEGGDVGTGTGGNGNPAGQPSGISKGNGVVDGKPVEGSGERGAGGTTPGGVRGNEEHPAVKNYEAKNLHIPGLKKSDSLLEEPRGLRGTDAPEITVTPNIDKKFYERGDLQEHQVQAIAQAKQVHESPKLDSGATRGILLGHRMGAGKTRMVAGIMLDNWNDGRKKSLWFSVNNGLMKDIYSDLKPFSLEKSLYNVSDGKVHDGIGFATYRDIIKEGFVDTLAKKLGPDFDGVIAFDECHKAKTEFSLDKDKKPDQGKTQYYVNRLQELLPKARVVYLSATSATEVSDLGYAQRLGLWGEKDSPFKDFETFKKNIKGKNLAGMEEVARTLKRRGQYLSCGLSTEGVDFQRSKIETSHQTKTDYIKYNNAVREVCSSIYESLKNLGNLGWSVPVGILHGMQQRMHNSMMSAVKLPTIIEMAKKDIAEGRTPVFSLVYTNAAGTERAVKGKLAEGEHAEMDETNFGPKQILMEFLTQKKPKHQLDIDYVDYDFPTMRFPAPKMGPDGKIIQGEPKVDPTSERMRQRLIAKVEALPDDFGNPINMIMDAFGKDNVANLTGLNEKNFDSDYRDFKDGKKKIMVFSKKANTGYSFHTHPQYKNKDSQRVMYVLQPGWRADEFDQTLGRVHRNGQVSLPRIVLTETDIPGEARFVSSVARRHGQLSSFTQGDRRQGADLIGEEDNYEDGYMHDAIQGVIGRLLAVDRSEVDDLAKSMNYIALNKEGQPVNKLLTIDKKTNKLIPADIKPGQFFNRMMLLDPEEQGAIFDMLINARKQFIQNDKDDGKFDPGLQETGSVRDEELKSFDLADDMQIKHINSFYKTNKVSYDDFVKRFHKVGPEGQDVKLQDITFVRNKRTGEIFAYHTDGTKKRGAQGMVGAVKRYAVNGDSERLYQSQLENRNVYEVLDEKTAKEAWDHEYAITPEERAEDAVYARGDMLKHWNDVLGARLPRTFFLKPEGAKGEFTGARLDLADIVKIAQRFNQEKAEKAVGIVQDSMIRKMMNGEVVEFKEGWKAKSVPRGDIREVMLSGFKTPDDAAKAAQKINGALGEDIVTQAYAHKKHVFIPEDRAFLRKVIDKFPVNIYDKSDTKVGDTGNLYFNKEEEVKTPSGTTLKRYKDIVGKEIHGTVYVHKNYANEVLPKDAWSAVEEKAKKLGLDYNCVTWNKGNKTIRLDQAPDFDTAREPKVGDYWKFDYNGNLIGGKGHSDQIWHHKWQWVKPDYNGFDVKKAHDWSAEWTQKISGNGTGIGKRETWDEKLREVGLPIDSENVRLEQKHTSAGTSLAKNEPTLFKDGIYSEVGKLGVKSPIYNYLKKGDEVLDIGAGKTRYSEDVLAKHGVGYAALDPFNRTAENNDAVIKGIEDGKRYPVVTAANLLNVLDTPELRSNVILQAAKAVTPNGHVLFDCYRAPTAGERGKGNDNFQTAMKPSEYLPEIKKWFKMASVDKNGIITASMPRPEVNNEKAEWKSDADGERTYFYDKREVAKYDRFSKPVKFAFKGWYNGRELPYEETETTSISFRDAVNKLRYRLTNGKGYDRERIQLQPISAGGRPYPDYGIIQSDDKAESKIYEKYIRFQFLSNGGTAAIKRFSKNSSKSKVRGVAGDAGGHDLVEGTPGGVVGEAPTIKPAGTNAGTNEPDDGRIGYNGPSAKGKLYQPELFFNIDEQAGKRIHAKNLDEAKRMLEGGADRRDIWKKTGWWKGKDNKWRYEIRGVTEEETQKILDFVRNSGKFYDKDTHSTSIDSYAFTLEQLENELRDKGEKLPTSLKTLMAAYPRISRQRIVLDFKHPKTAREIATLGYSSGKEVRLYKGGMSAETFNHELQHKIQEYAGMGRGTNPDRAGSFERYQKEHGEWEARLASARGAMTDSERKAEAPWETKESAGIKEDETAISDYNQAKIRPDGEEEPAAPENPLINKKNDTWNKYLENFQDRYHVLLETERKIDGRSKKDIFKKSSPYNAMRLLPGHLEAARARYENIWKRPFEKMLKDSGVTADQVGFYMMAKDVPARNAKVMARNGNLDGSGMTEEMAQDYITDMERRLGPKKMEAIKNMANHLWAMQKEGLDRRLASGRISKEMYDKWTQEEPFHVPMRTDYTEDGDGVAYSTKQWRQNDFKTAEGRKNIAASPTEFMLKEYQEAMYGSAENDARKVLGAYIAAHPELGSVKRGTKKTKGWSFTHGQIEDVVDPYYHEQRTKNGEGRPNLVAFKKDGNLMMIDMNGELGNRIAAAVTGRDVVRTPEWYNKIMRPYASTATELSPTFAGRNFLADMVETSLNTIADKGLFKGTAANIKNIVNAVRMQGTINAYNRTGEFKGKYADVMRKYVQSGASIGGAANEGFSDIKAEMKKIGKDGGVMSAIKTVGRVLSLYNKQFEMANRLAVFKDCIDSGYSEGESAMRSREYSTDFNKYGKQRWMNNIWMFSGSVIGSAVRQVESFAHAKHGVQALTGLFAFGMLERLAEHFWNQNEDEEARKNGLPSGDTMTNYNRANSFYFRNGDRFYRIPFHAGPFSVIKFAGNKLMGAILGDEKPSKAMKDALEEIKDTSYHFTGMGDAGPDLLQTILPTLAVPFAQAKVNTDFAGRPIERKMYSETKPYSENGRAKTGAGFKAMARWLNEISGGNKTRRGSWDMSPEMIEHAWNSLGKNVARDIVKVYDTINDLRKGEIDVDHLPFASDVNREVRDNTQNYYDADRKFRIMKDDASDHRIGKNGMAIVKKLQGDILNLRHWENGETKVDGKWVTTKKKVPERLANRWKSMRLKKQQRVIDFMDRYE